MKKTRAYYPGTLFLLLFFSAFTSMAPAQAPWAGLQRLNGTWKKFGVQQYEKWEPESANTMRGEGFSLISNTERDTAERLRIVQQEDGNIVYQATVAGQNAGATIDFPLTFFTTNSWTFENPEHDFPQKIEYWLQDDQTLRVSISGGDNEGVSWWFNKVDATVRMPVTLQGYTVFISSRNTGTVKRFDALTGQYLGEFGKEQIGGETQDLAIGPDGMLYVTSLQARRILKFDPATGAFLGYFSAGYELLKPTKLTFAPDGFAYVSQWGEGQSKVVRFDAKTGAFDRECTGALSGPLGHAWDGAGNLYVACFFSRDIRKYDLQGQFLGVVSPPDSLKGPSNLWFEPNGDLMVADWEDGTIKRLRPDAGQFLFHSPFATGFARLEGVAHGPDGFLYACDWYLNLVKKLDAQTGNEIGVYLEGNGMLRPNGLVFWKK